MFYITLGPITSRRDADSTHTLNDVYTVYRLPHGQYRYRGHVINLPQDVASFTTSLPRHPNDLDIVIVRKQG